MDKAYTVAADDSACIVFASRSVVARRRGANVLDLDFSEVESCKRSPEFDQYADTRIVPAQAQIAAGWRYECDHCYGYVDSDTEDAQYEGLHTVYCSIGCKHAAANLALREEQHTQAVIDAACERWPGITPMKTHGSIEFGKAILFKFPGGQNLASWTLGEDTLEIALADHPAWAVFTGKPVEIVPYQPRRYEAS